jgi:hypothetical protein
MDHVIMGTWNSRMILVFASDWEWSHFASNYDESQRMSFQSFIIDLIHIILISYENDIYETVVFHVYVEHIDCSFFLVLNI